MQRSEDRKGWRLDKGCQASNNTDNAVKQTSKYHRLGNKYYNLFPSLIKTYTTSEDKQGRRLGAF